MSLWFMLLSLSLSLLLSLVVVVVEIHMFAWFIHDIIICGRAGRALLSFLPLVLVGPADCKATGVGHSAKCLLATRGMISSLSMPSPASPPLSLSLPLSSSLCPPFLAPVYGCCMTLHHITSHHITSHHTTPHHTTSRHVKSSHITPHHTTLHHITTHRTTPHHNTPSYVIRTSRPSPLHLPQPWSQQR